MPRHQCPCGLLLAPSGRRGMRKQRYGRIISRLSSTARRGRATIHGYWRKKRASPAITLSLAAELGEHGLTCHPLRRAISRRNGTFRCSRHGFRRHRDSRVALRRWGKPRELARNSRPASPRRAVSYIPARRSRSTAG